MIFIVPMLTSGSVSPNVLPGIMKAVEKYTLIYGLDDILKAANSVMGKTVETTGKAITIASGGKLRIKEMDELTEIKPGQRLGGDPFSKRDPDETITAADIAKGIAKGIGKSTSGGAKESLKIDNPSYNALSLEPTWIQVQTSKKGLQILGVKAIPFPVKSKTGLINLLLQDTATKTADYLSKRYSRLMIRLMFRILRKLRIPLIKDKALTGNPEVDILWASSVYKRNFVVVLNQMELENSEIFSDPKTVYKLHKLGWSSFIITDDVNKRATFCMKEFGGVCSNVMYNYMFASLGKEVSQVYEDTEDARRSASPIFRMTTNKRKVFGDSIAYNKINQYTNLMEPLQEDIKSIVSKIKISDLVIRVSKIGKAIIRNNEEKLKDAVKGIPSISINKIESYLKKLSSDFNNNYKLAQRVIENSMNVGTKLTKATACIIAIGSVLKNEEDPTYETKVNLKRFIMSSRARNSDVSSFIDGATILMTSVWTILMATKVGPALKPAGVGIRLMYKGIIQLVTTNKTLVIILSIVLLLIFLVWISQDA